MKKRKLFVGVLLASAAFSLAACTGNNNDTTTSAGTPATTTNSGETSTTTSQTVQKYTVTFDSKGGKTVNAVEVNAGAKVQQPTNPTKERDAQYTYVFDKWCTDEACTTAFNFETAITGNIKLYAKWNTTVNQYTVTYESNGGSNVDTAAVDYNTAIGTAPTAPTKESTDQYDYTFDKWCSDEELQTPYDFTAPVTGDIKLYAKWTETVRTYSVTYDAGLEGLTPSVADLDSAEYGSTIAIPESLSKPAEGILTYEFGGWFLDEKFETPLTAESTVTGDTVVRAKWNISATISTVDDFLAFRQLETSEGVNAVNATLEADLDLDSVKLPVVKAQYYTGVFDGKGHTIKNASFEAQSSKQGMLVNYVDGGTFTNIKFLGCNATSKEETVGIIAGESYDGTYSKLEFNGCSVKTTGNYCGLIYGRNETNVSTIKVSEITTKNGCKTECSDYGGFLTGDVIGGTELIFEDLCLDGEFKTNSNGSFVAGRIRDNAIISIKNSVIKGNINGDSSKSGMLMGAGKQCEFTFENVIVIPTTATTSIYANNEKYVKSLKEDDEEAYAEAVKNCYFVKFSDTADHKTTYFGTEMKDSVTATWLQNTLKLDFTDIWTTEGETGYRLVSSSANVRNPGTTITKLTLAGKAPNRFKVDSDFTSDGLVVLATYSDGVQITINADGEDGYEVSSTSFDKATPGKYTITVTSKEDASIKATYEVEVVSQTGFELIDEFARKAYLIGEDIDISNVAVYSIWSDGLKEKATKGFTINADDYNKKVAGTYTISVSWTGFPTVEYFVDVIDTKPAVVDNYVYVNVDASLAAAYDMVDGVETFKTVTAALDYLAAANYDDSVIKVVYVAAGTYNEKITTSLNNLHLIGKDKATTIITYDAVEGTIDPLTDSAYVLNAATLHVNGTGFGLENITVRNDFDYIANSQKTEGKIANAQGLALTINGDGAVLNNVYLYGNQDTLYLRSGRVYVKNSLIEGNVDFIFGEPTGIAFFDTCEIKAIARGVNLDNNGYVTAMKVEKEDTKPEFGYVFYKCAFTNGDNVKDGSMALGRNWGKLATVAMIECSFTKAYSTLGYDGKVKSRWEKMADNPSVSDFAEYGSTGEGAIKEAVAGGKVLTATEAEKYTLANALAGENGKLKFTAAFNPTAALEALILEATTTQATVINVTNETYEIERNKTAELIATVGPWNSENKDVQYTFDNTKISYDGKTIKGLTVCDSTTITFTIGSVTKEVTIKVIPSSGINTVTFMDGDTEVTDLTITGAFGDPLTMPTDSQVQKTGYQFVKFYQDAAFTKEFDATTIPEEDTVVYLRYIELEKANVTYVSTADELIACLNNSSTTQYTIYITADLDFEGKTYAGLTGNFNSSVYGYGYSIKNWKVANAAEATSFFGITTGGVISDIVFENCEVTTDAKYVSILTSGAYGNETIEKITFKDCFVKNYAEKAVNTYSGLLAGAGNRGSEVLTVKNITSINSYVAGGQYSGGLFGYANAGSIVVDGLYGDIKVISTGASNKNTGGLIGWVKDRSFTLKNADVTVTVDHQGSTTGDGKGAALGGIVGGQQYSGTDKESSIIISDSKISIIMKNAGSYNGGIIGQDSLGTTKEGSTVTAVLEGTSNLIITDCEISFDIQCAKSSQCVGGITGRTQAKTANVTLKNVVLSGKITSPSDADNNNKNYAAIIGNCGSSTTIGSDKINNTNNVTLTNVSITQLEISVKDGAKANTVVGNKSGNGAADTTQFANVSYAASKVTINTTEALQGTNTEA